MLHMIEEIIDDMTEKAVKVSDGILEKERVLTGSQEETIEKEEPTEETEELLVTTHGKWSEVSIAQENAEEPKVNTRRI